VLLAEVLVVPELVLGGAASNADLEQVLDRDKDLPHFQRAAIRASGSLLALLQQFASVGIDVLELFLKSGNLTVQLNDLVLTFLLTLVLFTTDSCVVFVELCLSVTELLISIA
jgi:hypothetical protein